MLCALAGVDCDVRWMRGVLGHNGAGKSTVINILSGMHAPTSGEAWAYGHSILSDMTRIRENLGTPNLDSTEQKSVYLCCSSTRELEVFEFWRGFVAC